jgi:hypothetical protein
VARHLAADHGFRVYHTEPFSRYVARVDPVATPLLHGFMAMDMDERWVNRPPEVMLEAFRLQTVDVDGSVGVAESVARVGKALGL